MKSRLGKPGRYGDGDGLWLHVTAPGRGHWFLHYGGRGRQRQMALGSPAALALVQARTKAAEARTLIEQGVDPIAQRQGPEGRRGAGGGQ